MFERSIRKDNVVAAVRHGEVKMDYPDDEPYPNQLLLWFVKDRPLHVVVAQSQEDGSCYIVTAYIPSESQWDSDYKNRKTT